MKSLFALILMLFLAGCHTSGDFVVPKGSKLYLDGRSKPVKIREVDGRVRTRPFGWNAMGIPPHRGVPYRLEQDGKTIKEGKLRVKFRASSIFWPPFAIIYWPTGLNGELVYDLVNDTQKP
jgi:hypothetical protein